ncbi:MAG: hypothetical protein FRX49_09074 [Trebouxia sp. A1-2]|nr:MAG: hypothetical protein FRX49_09074 [Trebouxia sp. A1-2]
MGLGGEGLLPAAAGLFEIGLLAAPDRLLLEGLPAAAVLGAALLTAAEGLEAAPARRSRICIISKPTRLYRCVGVVITLVSNELQGVSYGEVVVDSERNGALDH